MPIGIDSSRSRVPEERSRSVVTLVTRNITMKGNIASSAGPKRSKRPPGRSANIHHSRVISTHGTTSSIASVRWSRRTWRSTRPATARVTRALMPRLPGPRRGAGRPARCPAAPVRRRISSGEPSAMIRPSRISSSRSQRSASSMTWLETSTAAPSSAMRWNRSHRSRRSTGSRPTVGSSSTSRSGWPSSATARLTRLSWPPESWPTTWRRWSPRPTTSMASSAERPSTPSTRAKNARFSATVRSS